MQLLDGVRNEGNRVNTQLTNIERVEVLKGPSSALYGGSALGATVNLIRKKPTPVQTHDFAASAGSWKTGRFAYGAGGRVGSDATLYRFDIGAETKDGYRNNDATRLTVNPSLLWRAGANQVNVFYTFNRDRFAGDAGLPLTDFDFGVALEDNVLNVPRDRNYRTPQDEAKSYDNNIQVQYARPLRNSLGFRNTFSYRRFDDKYFLSEEIYFVPPDTIDRWYLYFYHHRRPVQNVAELTGYFTKGIEQNLVLGYEIQRYHSHSPRPDNDYFQAASINAFDPVETQGPSVLTPDTRASVFTNVTNAVYVQDHLTLAPQIKLLLGGRFDVYRRESHVDPIVNGERMRGPVSEFDAEAFTGRAGLVYQPSRVVEAYGSFANSFKPINLSQPDGSTLDPETGSQLELGGRFHLAQDRIQLNTAVYRILRENVAFRRPAGFYDLAGEVTSRGFELDLQSTLAANARLGAAYGFTDAEFLDYEQSLGTNLRGDTPVFAPRHTFNFWTAYDWNSGLGVNVGARYLGRTFADNANQFEVDGYGVLNLAVRYRRGPFEYALNVNNVTDTEYFTPHLDWAQVYPGDPINVLATVRVRLQ
ncbi:MAG: TonB-dependent receptor [Luteitalea sp.]|nr:TonB-dependent receptor [Luteitalea sp.]